MIQLNKKYHIQTHIYCLVRRMLLFRQNNIQYKKEVKSFDLMMNRAEYDKPLVAITAVILVDHHYSQVVLLTSQIGFKKVILKDGSILAAGNGTEVPHNSHTAEALNLLEIVILGSLSISWTQY